MPKIQITEFSLKTFNTGSLKLAVTIYSMSSSSSSSSSSSAQQPLMGPGLLQKLCPFIPVKGDDLPILDL
jgi:hypothetical protein